MTLAIDIGNTSIHFGVFNSNKLVFDIKRTTNKKDLNDIIRTFKNIKKKFNIKSVAVSSVVPSIDSEFNKIIRDIFNIKPFIIDSYVKTGIENLSKKYKGLGSDRICDISYGSEKYNSNLIIVNMGTATKFEVVDENYNYLGGAIGPGLINSYYSIISSADKLKKDELKNINTYFKGANTIEQLSSGFILGFTNMVDGMVDGIIKEVKFNKYKIILTGGQSEIIKNHLRNKYILDEFLTLKGVNYIYNINYIK